MEAFKEKDRERESLLQKKVNTNGGRIRQSFVSIQMKEYGELEKQMKKTLIDIEKREKQLSINEHEVIFHSSALHTLSLVQIQRMQVDLKRDYDNKHIEIREASKRLQEQSDHQITLEKY